MNVLPGGPNFKCTTNLPILKHQANFNIETYILGSDQVIQNKTVFFNIMPKYIF